MRALGAFRGPGRPDPPKDVAVWWEGNSSYWVDTAGNRHWIEPPALNGHAVDLAKPAEPEVSEARDLARVAVKLAAPRAAVEGGAFIFGVPERPEPVWGNSEAVLWSKGEYLLFCGPTGVGKTTLEQQVALARMGLLDDVLGMPVEPDDRNVLLLALDRPDQIARSMRRMVGEADRPVLDAKIGRAHV